jgi:hypothetical protein
MKKISLCIITCFIVKASCAQISIPVDSVKRLLCQKWGFKAILMGGQRLTNMNESVTYEFLTDGSLKRVSSDGKAENGNWEYKPDAKIILLKIKKTTLHIPALSNDELIVSPGTGSDQTKNNMAIGTILKPMGSN